MFTLLTGWQFSSPVTLQISRSPTMTFCAVSCCQKTATKSSFKVRSRHQIRHWDL